MFSHKQHYPKDSSGPSKYKYNLNSNIYDLTMSNSSLDSKIGATRAKEPISTTLPEKIKSNASFSLSKMSRSSLINLDRGVFSTSKKNATKEKEYLRLPQIRRMSNPEEQAAINKPLSAFYIAKIYRAFKNKENTYMMNLARQHFIQTIQALRIGRRMKLAPPVKELKLSKKNPKFKTIFLDLDETLIHCDESSTNCTVKLNFPIEGGGTISAGIRVRPFCHEFIKELSEFAEIVIFTASASSYADVVLDYLDPQKKYFAHRLYRQHCTLEKGFYTKDLRITNRKLEDVVIVDNSGFTFMTQPEFGIPILPFYHFSKDKELELLLQFLKELVKEDDMRKKVLETFHWSSFLENDKDPRTIFKKIFNISD